MGKVILGYWDIRGLAEVAKLMLEYGGVEYEDKRYKCGQEPPYDRSIWLDVKFTLGLDFPNLPYFIDGDLKITESWAIYRYIARKIGLAAMDTKQQAHADMLEGVINTMRQGLTSVCYTSKDLDDFNSRKPAMRSAQENRLKLFDDYLTGKKYLTGDNVQHVDFALFETLDHHRMMFPDIFDKFTNVGAFMKRFDSLDKVAAYHKSSRFQKLPVNNPQAKWGNKYE